MTDQERRKLIDEVNQIVGQLWVDLFNADLVKASGADCFDRRRQQIKNLGETLH